MIQTRDIIIYIIVKHYSHHALNYEFMLNSSIYTQQKLNKITQYHDGICIRHAHRDDNAHESIDKHIAPLSLSLSLFIRKTWQTINDT